MEDVPAREGAGGLDCIFKRSLPTSNPKNCKAVLTAINAHPRQEDSAQLQGLIHGSGKDTLE